jgi:hypothetical protein
MAVRRALRGAMQRGKKSLLIFAYLAYELKQGLRKMGMNWCCEASTRARVII